MELPRQPPSAEEIAEFVRRHFPHGVKEFRPFAVYDPQLNRVWVQVRDCSVCEKRVNGVLYLLKDNYPEREEQALVGFEIYRATDILRLLGTDLEQVRVRELIDCVAAISDVPEKIRSDIRVLAEEHGLERIEQGGTVHPRGWTRLFSGILKR